MLEEQRPHLRAVDSKRRLLRGNEIKNLPPPQPLISGLLDLDTTALLYGGTGWYKSFLAIDWSLSIATGLAWNNRAVHPGNVLYIAGEGYTGLGQRLAAWQAYHNSLLDPPVFWLDGVPRVLTSNGQDELLQYVKELRPVLTIIDTIARATAGTPENDSETMTRLVEVLDSIRRASHGGTALGIHHSGRSENVHLRGHSALDAGVDTILRFHEKTLFVEKQKHHEQGYTFGTFTPAPSGSSIVLTLDPPAVQTYTPNQQKVLDALKGFAGEATYGDLRRASLARGVPAGSFDRVLNSLLRGPMVATDGTDGGSVYRWR